LIISQRNHAATGSNNVRHDPENQQANDYQRPGHPGRDSTTLQVAVSLRNAWKEGAKNARGNQPPRYQGILIARLDFLEAHGRVKYLTTQQGATGSKQWTFK
jgi:hypothetical protein